MADSSGNTLYYGDNLDVLREYDDEAIKMTPPIGDV